MKKATPRKKHGAELRQGYRKATNCPRTLSQPSYAESKGITGCFASGSMAPLMNLKMYRA